MCKLAEELTEVKEDLKITTRMCEEFSKRYEYGIWKADQENNIYFMNDVMTSIFQNSPSNLSDIFTQDEILLFQHNTRLEFNYNFNNNRYKVIFEKSENGNSFGIVKKIDTDEDTINKLLVLKKEFKQILEEW